MPQYQTLKVSRKIANPSRSTRKVARNAHQLLTLGLLNPSRKEDAKMPRSTKKKATPARTTPKRRSNKRAKNPMSYATRGRSHKHTNKAPKRRNPTRQRTTKIVDTSVELVKAALPALVGLVATRQIPQIAMKEKNTGVLGYALNGITALGVGWLVGKFADKRSGIYAAVGGVVYLVSRVLTEQLNPIGKYLALTGVGDYQTMGGVVRDQYNVLPSYSETNPADGSMPRQTFPPQLAKALQEARQLPAPAPTMGAWDGDRVFHPAFAAVA